MIWSWKIVSESSDQNSTIKKATKIATKEQKMKTVKDWLHFLPGHLVSMDDSIIDPKERGVVMERIYSKGLQVDAEKMNVMVI